MQLTFRAGAVDDLDAFYRALFHEHTYNHAMRAAVDREWHALLGNPTTITMVVEDRERPEGDRILGCAQVAFVTDRFIRYVRHAQPDLPLWEVARPTNPLPDGSWPLLSLEELRRANSGEGLNALMTRFQLAEQRLSVEQEQVAAEYLTRNFALYYRGYKYKEWMALVYGEPARLRAMHTGFRLVNDYHDYYRKNPPEPTQDHPYLVSVTREEALAQPGSVASLAFTYTPPRFFFKPHEQELLWRAVLGEIDLQIAKALSITEGAVKKRWLSIFARVAHRDPHLLPESEPTGVRGVEKRRRLLSYLDDHLEELRPILPPPQARG